MIISQPPIWDIATAALFVKEAGGIVATTTGKSALKDLTDAPYVIATNLVLFDKLQKELKGVK